MQVYKKNGDYTETFKRYMRNAYNRYLQSDCDDIHKAYAKPSAIKQETWWEIYQLSGHTARIIASNCMFYVAAYVLDDENGNECLVVETAFATYCIELQYIQQPSEESLRITTKRPKGRQGKAHKLRGQRNPNKRRRLYAKNS